MRRLVIGVALVLVAGCDSDNTLTVTDAGLAYVYKKQ